MNAIVSGVSRSDEAHRGDMQAGRFVGGMRELHNDQILPLEIDDAFGQLFRNHEWSEFQTEARVCGEACSRIFLTTFGAATERAPGKR
jgi:hypothetical protein